MLIFLNYVKILKSCTYINKNTLTNCYFIIYNIFKNKTLVSVFTYNSYLYKMSNYIAELY